MIITIALKTHTTQKTHHDAAMQMQASTSELSSISFLVMLHKYKYDYAYVVCGDNFNMAESKIETRKELIARLKQEVVKIDEEINALLEENRTGVFA